MADENKNEAFRDGFIAATVSTESEAQLNSDRVGDPRVRAVFSSHPGIGIKQHGILSQPMGKSKISLIGEHRLQYRATLPGLNAEVKSHAPSYLPGAGTGGGIYDRQQWAIGGAFKPATCGGYLIGGADHELQLKGTSQFRASDTEHRGHAQNRAIVTPQIEEGLICNTQDTLLMVGLTEGVTVPDLVKSIGIARMTDNGNVISPTIGIRGRSMKIDTDGTRYITTGEIKFAHAPDLFDGFNTGGTVEARGAFDVATNPRNNDHAILNTAEGLYIGVDTRLRAISQRNHPSLSNEPPIRNSLSVGANAYLGGSLAF